MPTGDLTISEDLNEKDDDHLDELAELFPDSESMASAPVVYVKNDDENTLIDGHHRYLLAKSRGDDVPAIAMSSAEYEHLKSSGYSKEEITRAALGADGSVDPEYLSQYDTRYGEADQNAELELEDFRRANNRARSATGTVTVAPAPVAKPTAPKPPAKPTARPTVAGTLERIRHHLANPDTSATGPDTHAAIAAAIADHTHDELRQIRAHLGIKAGGKKADVIAKMAVRAVQGKHDRSDRSKFVTASMTPDEAHAALQAHLDAPEVDHDALAALGTRMAEGLTVKELGEVKRRLGVRAGGGKAAAARKLVDRAVAADAARKAAPAVVEPVASQPPAVEATPDDHAIESAVREAADAHQYLVGTQRPGLHRRVKTLTGQIERASARIDEAKKQHDDFVGAMGANPQPGAVELADRLRAHRDEVHANETPAIAALTDKYMEANDRLQALGKTDFHAKHAYLAEHLPLALPHKFAAVDQLRPDGESTYRTAGRVEVPAPQPAGVPPEPVTEPVGEKTRDWFQGQAESAASDPAMSTADYLKHENDLLRQIPAHHRTAMEQYGLGMGSTPKEPAKPKRPFVGRDESGKDKPLTPDQEAEFRQATAGHKAALKQFATDKTAHEAEYGNAAHRGHVEAALAAGKPVPPEVLADYPDLKPTLPVAAPEPAPALTPSTPVAAPEPAPVTPPAPKPAAPKAPKAAPAPPGPEAAKEAAAHIDGMLTRMAGGGFPKAALDAGLAKLDALDQAQLLHAAKLLEIDAGLTAKTPRAKVLKQIGDMVARVWKTSDNVTH